MLMVSTKWGPDSSARSGTEQSWDVLRAAEEELLEAERERWRQEMEAQRAVVSDAP